MRTKAKTAKGKKDAVKKKVRSLPKSDGQLQVECKVCESLEDRSKMHICDCCEKAFHMSCCLEAAWFCSHGCWINKPKPALSMVRVSRKFQVDVLPQYDADSSDEDYFGGMTPTNFNGPSEWNFAKVSSVGNWIQCVGYKDEDEKDKEGDVCNNVKIEKGCGMGRRTKDRKRGVCNNLKMEKGCGKWRRAPLSVEHSEEWNCYTAVTWDPFHADCAVPQFHTTDYIVGSTSLTVYADCHIIRRRLKLMPGKWFRFMVKELPTSEVEKQLVFMKKVKELVTAKSMEEVAETWRLA